MEHFDYQNLLGHQRKRTLSFAEFVDDFIKHPEPYLHTSSSLIRHAIKFFGFDIVVRSGEPMIRYNMFKDLFFNGINAVYGQETCIKHVLDVIEAAEKEGGPNRGIVLVGPPASGKTNIVELICAAIEEYTKIVKDTGNGIHHQEVTKLFSFYFEFGNEGSRTVELRSSFRHNPLLLFPTTMIREDGSVDHPRQKLFEYIKKYNPNIHIPQYYENSTLDKRTLDILEALRENPRNRDKSLFTIIEEYVRVEEIEFSIAQAKGIANIDDMGLLRVRTRPLDWGPEAQQILDEHMPGKKILSYDGAMVDSNRGIIHVHDAFGVDGRAVPEMEYKPLLMLLGSGKTAVESTHTQIDNTVILTTNIEEMELLNKQLTSSKLLDRIEKIPVNYLLDASSEIDILKRDMSHFQRGLDIDPNLLRVAAYYSVVTRMLSPVKKKLPVEWSEAKKELYYNITPEQKLMIYSSQSEDPVVTIQNLPHWHPFRNEAMRLNIDLNDPESYIEHIQEHPFSVRLRDCGLFSEEELRLIDDEFMRVLRYEHYPYEGQCGLSIRQLQNIMRNTIANSDGNKIHVGIFLSQLKRIMLEGSEMHHWLHFNPRKAEGQHHKLLPARNVGGIELGEGEGAYQDYRGLVKVVKGLYYNIVRKEITICTVDRNPELIEMDLRRYLQHSLLARAIHNKAFAHVMVPKFTFIDPVFGRKIHEPDYHFMASIEQILCSHTNYQMFRHEIAQKFLDLQNSGELRIAEDKSIVTSTNDRLMDLFANEFQKLLSHRKVADKINPETLHNAFFHKRNEPEAYLNYPEEMKDFVERILSNLQQRYRYSPDIALDTVVFALRKGIIDFGAILS